MGESTKKLMSFLGEKNCYDPAEAEIRDLQIAAMNERLQEQRDTIKIVNHRAEEAEIREIRCRADAVPLLLPHTAYKSYPERFLLENRFDRLSKWLGTVSTLATETIDLDGVADIDEWVDRCQQAGILLSCSSGTTGKPAMLAASQADIDFSCKDGMLAVEWGSDIRIGDKRSIAGFGTIAHTPRNTAMGMAMMSAFIDMSKPKADTGIPPITIGSITKMIALRKAIAEGAAQPEEIAEFDKESAKRQQAVEAAVGIAAEDVISKRGDRLYLMGMWPNHFKLAEEVRKRGYSGQDFHPENAVYLGGGVKGAKLPPNFKEYVYETFNLNPRFIYQMYGMQEINSTIPRCQGGGRYHIPPWVVCLPLNREGNELMPVDQGKVQGRAAFFDLSLTGRWGGVISGDHIEVDFSPCVCGAGTPSISDDIQRYSDLEGDDKIACSGTVDAYVRGMS